MLLRSHDETPNVQLFSFSSTNTRYSPGATVLAQGRQRAGISPSAAVGILG
jgi:hypothetical protein